jgi:hypothetical protein
MNEKFFDKSREYYTSHITKSDNDEVLDEIKNKIKAFKSIKKDNSNKELNFEVSREALNKYRKNIEDIEDMQVKDKEKEKEKVNFKYNKQEQSDRKLNQSDSKNSINNYKTLNAKYINYTPIKANYFTINLSRKDEKYLYLIKSSYFKERR